MKKVFGLFLVLIASSVQADYMRYVSVKPTVTASSAYTAKDSVGGLLTFSNVGCRGGGGYVNAVIVTDNSDTPNAVEYNFWPFRRIPTGTATNKTAFNPTDANAGGTGDLDNALPVINIASTDCFTASANAVCSLSSLNSWIISSTANETIYGVLTTGGTPTYGATDSVTVTLMIYCR